MEKNKKVVKKVSREIRSKLKDLQIHFKEYGWKLDADYYINEITEKIIGIDVHQFLLENTYKLSEDLEIPLVVDFIDKKWYIIPLNSVKVYYNPISNSIEMKVVNSRTARDIYISYNFYYQQFHNKVFLGFL